MKVNVYSTNKLQTNCYVVENDNECIVIDPCVKYQDIFENSKLEIKAVFLTHGHFDHIDQINTYKNKGLTFYMHKNAYPKLKDPVKNCSILTGFRFSYNLDNENVVFIDDGDILNILDNEFKIMYTPGHSDCSIVIIVNDIAFSGDLLFRQGIGRYDLYSSNYSDLLNSLNKIENLQTNYKLLPGHGPQTNLDFEKVYNPYFR